MESALHQVNVTHQFNRRVHLTQVASELRKFRVQAAFHWEPEHHVYRRSTPHLSSQCQWLQLRFSKRMQREASVVVGRADPVVSALLLQCRVRSTAVFGCEVSSSPL